MDDEKSVPPMRGGVGRGDGASIDVRFRTTSSVTRTRLEATPTDRNRRLVLHIAMVLVVTNSDVPPLP